MQGIGMNIGMHQNFLGMPLGLILQIFIILALFLITYWLLKSAKTPLKESAIEILNRRYANGELTKKQFLNLKKDISK